MSPKLFMTLVGCDSPGRNTEQHDVFFGIGQELKDLAPQIRTFWPDAIKPHLDAWREVSQVNGYSIRVVERVAGLPAEEVAKAGLFFLNLGGYKKDEFEEFHYRMIVVAKNKGDAIQQAKKTAFFKHIGVPGATSHVDDKYGVDVDDIMEIKDILPKDLREKYSIIIQPAGKNQAEDPINLGYFLIDKL